MQRSRKYVGIIDESIERDLSRKFDYFIEDGLNNIKIKTY
jgi:hypothetical protein